MTKISSTEVFITRVFAAPVERVWKYWTDPARVKKWWGPKNFTAPTIVIDFQVGGKYLYCMRGKPAPDAPTQDFWSTGTYREIVRPNPSAGRHGRIVASDNFADPQGKIVPASYYGLEDFPLDAQVTVIFEPTDGKTKMTLHHTGLPAGEMKKQTGLGWNESFDKLEKILT